MAKTGADSSHAPRALDTKSIRCNYIQVEIKQAHRTNAMVVEIAGKFVIEQVQNFEATFKTLVKGEPANVAVDLTSVDVIDSSGIGALIKALNLVKNYGGKMILFGMKPLILNVFKIAKLDNFFIVMTAQEFNNRYPAA